MKLEKKISMYVLGMVLAAVFIVQFVFFKNAYKILDINKNRALNGYSRVLSIDQTITKKLFEKNKGDIEKHMSYIWPELINLNFIIITDLKGNIYSYRNKKSFSNPQRYYKKILEKMIPKMRTKPDIYYNFDSDNNYLQEFTPIRYNGKLIGMLGVQEYHHQNKDLKNILYSEIFLGGVVILIMSVLLSMFLAKNIKSQLLGYEPLEITKIYEERELIFDNLTDQIITLDNHGKLTKMNEKTKINFNKKDEKVFRKLYDEILMKEGNNISNRKIMMSNGEVFISCMKIKQKNNNFEILFIIKQGERVKKIAREITGVAQIIDSMRANVHEFKNKIHVISGLLRLEEYEEVKQYVIDIKNELDYKNKEVQAVKDPIISALLLTKISLAKEKHIFLDIEDHSNLMKSHNNIETDDLIVIIGNLIENAMESFDLKILMKKMIKVQLLEDSNKIFICISDNGREIINSDHIFEMGYSSKGKGRGSGLALIKNLVSLYDGKIDITHENKYKLFNIELKKEGKL